MRVVHLIKVTGISGAERHLLMLLSGLRETGIDTQLILLVEPKNPVDEMVEEAEERNIPVQRVVIYHHLDVTLYWRLWRLLRQLQPDILHTHLWHADFFGIPAGRVARKATLLTGRHNDDAFRYRRPVRWINRILWKLVKGGTAISSAIRDFSIAIEGVSPNKVSTVRYGTEHESVSAETIESARLAIRRELGVGDDAIVVGMVGRFVEQKGFLYGIQGMAPLIDRIEHLHLLIAGDGDLRDELEAEARQLGIQDRVHFLGWRTDIPRVMASLDIFLMPSLWEGFGMVLLEAMSKRVPVVASDVSAIPEIVVDGETGLLVPPRDPIAITQALYPLIHDAHLRKHMGFLGECRLEKDFNVERMVKETIAVYEEWEQPDD